MLDLIFIVMLTLISFAVYANTLNGEFVYDDHQILLACDKVWNPEKYLREKPPYVNMNEGAGFIRRTIEWILRRHRHILYWSYFRDARIHGKENRVGWHASNVALHIVSCVLLYALLRGYFEQGSAFLGAALVSVHPMATNATSLIYGRASLFCAVFYLSGLLAAVIGGWAWILVPVFFLGGWLSKQEIVLLPVAILATYFILR